MEVNAAERSCLHCSLTPDPPVSCSQVFYYFQHYSHKDDVMTKAVVRLDKPPPLFQILT